MDRERAFSGQARPLNVEESARRNAAVYRGQNRYQAAMPVATKKP